MIPAHIFERLDRIEHEVKALVTENESLREQNNGYRIALDEARRENERICTRVSKIVGEMRTLSHGNVFGSERANEWADSLEKAVEEK